MNEGYGVHMQKYGALEAGGTKMVCSIGDEYGNIFETNQYLLSIPTRIPNAT